jgi:HAD superfamily hydrolase (TIGR01549 family)
MTYAAVIFDLDDTLLKTYPIKWDQHKEAARRFYGINLNDETLRLHWGKPTSEMVRHLYEDAEDAETMVEKFRSLDAHYLKSIHDDVLESLKRIHKIGLSINVATNSSQDSATHDLERLGIPLSYFDSIFGIEKNKVYKPDPKALRPLLKALAAKGITTKIVYVGDSLIDYEASTGIGIEFIGVATGVTTEKDFREAGVTRIISKLTDLPSLL